MPGAKQNTVPEALAFTLAWICATVEPAAMAAPEQAIGSGGTGVGTGLTSGMGVGVGAGQSAWADNSSTPAMIAAYRSMVFPRVSDHSFFGTVVRKDSKKLWINPTKMRSEGLRGREFPVHFSCILGGYTWVIHSCVDSYSQTIQVHCPSELPETTEKTR